MKRDVDMCEKTAKFFEEYDVTKVITGDCAFLMLTDLFIREKAKSMLICAGGDSARDPQSAVQKVMKALSGLEIETVFCMDIPPEPTVEDVRRIVGVMEKNQMEKVLAIGGGSVMDAAKAAYLSFQSGKDVTELFGVNQVSAAAAAGEYRKVVCIPTTSGTGSEVTPYSNIVDDASGVKKLIVEKAIIPQWAFVDASVTVSMPGSLTVTTALDALVHSLESFFNNTSPDAPEEAEEWALESIRLIAENLPEAVQDGKNLAARKALAEAAVLGGMCITHRPTSLPHLASFSLYGKVSHGQAVAALLPAFWRYYIGEKSVEERTMRLAGIFAQDKESDASSVIDSFVSFIRKVGGAPSPGELGLEKELIEKIAKDAVLNPVKLQSCPRKISMENASSVISGILTSAW